jgi:hypothetical protein
MSLCKEHGQRGVLARQEGFVWFSRPTRRLSVWHDWRYVQSDNGAVGGDEADIGSAATRKVVERVSSGDVVIVGDLDHVSCLPGGQGEALARRHRPFRKGRVEGGVRPLCAL